MTLPNTQKILQSQSGMALFSAVFQQHPDAVSLTRVSDGLLLEVNDAWLAMTGYQRDEIIGKTTVALGIWGGDSGIRQQAMAPLVAESSTLQSEYILHAKGGGQRAIHVNGTRLLLDGVPHLLACLR